MISAYRAPCWRERRAIGIYSVGPKPLHRAQAAQIAASKD
jgi:hypothetical protein